MVYLIFWRSNFVEILFFVGNNLFSDAPPPDTKAAAPDAGGLFGATPAAAPAAGMRRNKRYC